MARIFISHSNQDNAEAVAFRDWLVSIGYTIGDIFLDLESIRVGDHWRDALRTANQRCEAVILLASPAALTSEEVRREIILAEEYQKPILVGLLAGLNISDNSDGRLTPYRHLQLVDLAAEPRNVVLTIEHTERPIRFNGIALAKLRVRLDELGLEAATFAWTPQELDTANPYPGLRGYSEEEAGLFFGRDPDIALGLSKLRALRKTDDGRLLLIQAASGAGKSSFLKAGLWPRLRRDGDFKPLMMLRPSGGALSGPNGMARALSARLTEIGVEARSPAALAALLKGDPERAADGLAELLDQITRHATAARRVAAEDAPAPSLVIGLDQAEELLDAPDAAESRQFIALFAQLSKRAETGMPILVFTIRDEAVGALTRAAQEASLPTAELMSLPPIPRERFIQIIEEPARVASEAGLSVTIAPDLTQRLIADSQGRDALPLLSVMLEQLVEDHRIGSKVDLKLAPYLEAGGVESALRSRLRDACARADNQIRGAGSDKSLKALMIPHLATWDGEAAGVKRQIAHEAPLLTEDQSLAALAERLVESHLLTRSADDRGVTLEVAHESLLRQPPISDWLAEDAEFLGWLSRVDKDREAYEAQRRGLLSDIELKIAQGFLETRKAEIPADALNFIEASLDRATQLEYREKNRDAKISIGSLAILIAILLFAGNSQSISAHIADSFLSSFYGYTDKEHEISHVSRSTKSIAIIIIDSESLASVGEDFPFDSFFEYQIISRLMNFSPLAIFYDLSPTHNVRRDNSMSDYIAEDAKLAGVDIIFGLPGDQHRHHSWRNNILSSKFPIAYTKKKNINNIYDLQVLNNGERKLSVAATMLEYACKSHTPNKKDLPGCLNYKSISNTTSDQKPLLTVYGSVNQATWQPFGVLNGIYGSEFHKKAETLNTGCHYFPPDLSGRLWEFARTTLLPFNQSSRVNTCNYNLTIPIEMLMDNSAEMNEYLSAVLHNKIVFAGTWLSPSDYPNVFDHAMATDNLLYFGENYLKPDPNSVTPLISNGRIIEIFIIPSIVLAIYLASRKIFPRRQAKSSWEAIRLSLTTIIIWGIFILGLCMFVMIYFRLPYFNWIGTFANCAALSVSLYFLLERRRQEHSKGRLPPPSPKR